MIRRLVEIYVQQTKSKDFYFDEAITSSIILTFSLSKVIALFRGLRMILPNRKFNKVFFGKSVTIFNKKNLRIGNNVNIGNYVNLYALGSGLLTIGNNVNIGSFSQVVISTTFSNLGRYIKIGDNVGIGEFCYLGGAGGLEIGADTIIGQYFSTHPENHIFEDATQLIRLQGVERLGIKVGNNCWVGSKVTILDGVVIGDNCVIAAGAVVTHSVANNVVVAGVPARVIKNL